MRPRPATWAASIARDIQPCPSPLPRRRAFYFDRAPKSASFSTRLRTARSAVHWERPRFGLALWGRHSKEAATPGQPSSRIKRFLEPSRQFTLENCREPLAFSMLRQVASNIPRLRVSNLPEAHRHLKRKLRLHCEQTVQDENLLWKAREKWAGDAIRRFRKASFSARFS